MQITTPLVATAKVDPTEAPEGYIAVLKSQFHRPDGYPNLCSFCDYRIRCSERNADGKLWNCFPGDNRPEVFARRKDNCSVVFKLKK